MLNNQFMNNSWEDINTSINHINNKTNKIGTLWIFIIIIASIGMFFIGGYYFSSAIANSFNLAQFSKQDLKFDSDTNEIKVNMSEVPIYTSKNSLRLEFFKNTLNKRLFNKIISNNQWTSLLPQDINYYNFTWYNKDWTNELSIEDINHDGQIDANIQFSFKKYNTVLLRRQFIAIIQNTGIFIRNFMEFNYFESRENDNKSTIDSDKRTLGVKGYLSSYFNFGDLSITDSDNLNKKVYEEINKKINLFLKNEKQEFGSNFNLYPILITDTYTKDLPDINWNSPSDNINNLEPYTKLSNRLNDIYIDKNEKYVKLEPSQGFKILYSPVDNLLEKISTEWQRDRKIEDLITYFKNNSHEFTFLPFLNNNKSFDNNKQEIHKCSVIHKVLPLKDWNEVSRYFYESTNTFDIDRKPYFDNYQNMQVGPLKQKLKTLFLNNLFEIYCQSRKYLYLTENFDSTNNVSANFDSLTNKSSFLNYFKLFFASPEQSNNDIISIQFFDKNRQVLNLNDNEIVPINQVKHIALINGPDFTSNVTMRPFAFYLKAF